MNSERRCKAQIYALNSLGEGVASKNCDYKRGGKKNGNCELVELAARGYKVTPQNTPCLKGYKDNLPKLPSEN